MKSTASFFAILSTSLLALIVVSLALPNRQAAAAAVIDPTQEVLKPTPVPTEAPTCDARRSIQVSGTAVITVIPDRALIQLGVQSNGRTAKDVERRNSTATQAIIQAVKRLGVEARDIATNVYVIEPVYENYDDLYIKGYRINNIVAVTLRDVSKTSQVLAAALQAGANQVINVDFYTSELRKYRDQARELAMKAAKEKARDLTSAAGAKVGCVLSINENSWSYYNGWWWGRSQNQSQNQWTQNVIQNAAPGAGQNSGTDDEPISLGQISVKAEISASFGIQ